MDIEAVERLRKRFQMARGPVEKEIERLEHNQRIYKEIKKIYEQDQLIRRLKK